MTTNVGDVLRWVNAVKQSYVSVIPPAVVEDLSEFLNELPDDLDLGSASYYLKKEFKANDTGVDERFHVYTDYSGYDDDDDDWDDEDWDHCDDCGY